MCRNRGAAARVGEHDAPAWVGPDELELLMDGRTDGDRRLLDIVARAVRSTVTDRLRLEPVTTGHAADLHAYKRTRGWPSGTPEPGRMSRPRRAPGGSSASGRSTEWASGWPTAVLVVSSRRKACSGSAVGGPDAVFALYLIGPDLR